MSRRARQPNGSSFSGWARAAAIAALGVVLPGCPLSDEYFVKEDAHHPPPPSGMAGRAGPGDAGRAGSNTGGGGWGGDRTWLDRGGTTSVSALPDECETQRYEEHAYVLCLPAGMERANHLDASMRCVTYAEAAGVAASAIMDLVVVDSAEENQFLVDWLSGKTRDPGLIWLGATDIIREKTWVWGRVAGTTQFFTQEMRGGTPFMDRYNDFADNRPDGTADDEQDCGAFDSSLEWRWDDERCSESALGFVCEEVSQ